MSLKNSYLVVACVAGIALLACVRHWAKSPVRERPGTRRDAGHAADAPPATGPALELADVARRDSAGPVREPSSNGPAPAAIQDSVEPSREPLRVQVLKKALRHSESMPRSSALEKAYAANILLTVCVTTIMDARGEYVEHFPWEEVALSIPPGMHSLQSGERLYAFRIDEFPEFSEIVEIIKGRGKTMAGVDANEYGTDLDEILIIDIQLRYEEALALARSMSD